MASKRWSNTTKSVVIALLILGGLALLLVFRAMIEPTIVAFLLAFILHHPVNWVQQRTGWSRGSSVATVYGLLLILLLVAPVLFVPGLVDSFVSLLDALQTLIDQLQGASGGPVLTVGDFDLSINTLLQQLGAALQDVLSPAAASALGLARTLTTGVLSTVYILVLTFWLLKDGHKAQRGLFWLVPTDYREDVALLGRELGAIWYAFLRGQLLLALVIGLMTWVAMSLVGLPNAAGLSLLAAVMEFLPTVGPGISGTIGTLVALFQGSTWMPVNNLVFALIVLGLYVVITQIESVYLIPRLVGRRVRLHPAITFTGIISAAITFGVLGVLLITPTIASAREILRYVIYKLQDLEPFAQDTAPTQVRIPGLIAGRRIEAVVFELDGPLVQVDWSLADQVAARLARLDPVWPLPQRRGLFRRLQTWLEGPVYRWIGLLRWFQLHDDLRRMWPWLRRLQALAPPAQATLRPGVQPLLEELGFHYRLGLLTLRPAQELQALVEHTHLPLGAFAATVTQDDVGGGLAFHSDALQLLLDRLGVSPDRILVVADTEFLLRPAQALGAVRCGMLGGLGAPENFRDVDLVVASPEELQEHL